MGSSGRTLTWNLSIHSPASICIFPVSRVQLTDNTGNIATSWQQVFEGDLFGAFEAAALKVIHRLIKDVEDSAALGLKDRVRGQSDLCLEEAKVALKKTLELVRQAMNNEQKEVSRCLAPHVQNQLIDGYDLAMEERGTGSVARQKAVFHSYIDDCKDDVFEDGADVILNRLSKAAEAIGTALSDALAELAEKVIFMVCCLGATTYIWSFLDRGESFRIVGGSEGSSGPSPCTKRDCRESDRNSVPSRPMDPSRAT